MRTVSCRVTVKNIVCKLNPNDKVHRTILARYNDYGVIDDTGTFLHTTTQHNFQTNRKNGFGKTCRTYERMNRSLVEVIVDNICDYDC